MDPSTIIERSGASQLFATPFLKYQIPDHASLNAALLAEGHAQRAASDGTAKSNKGGWHSDGNFFLNDAACIQTLLRATHKTVFDATHQVSPDLDIKTLDMALNGWMNINPEGAYNAPHTHPGAHWSGVYYVNQPEVADGSSGMIEFMDPRTDLPHWRILDAKTFAPKFKLRPQAGMMILFPSYLVHWVYPNTSPEDRVTIAFNATFQIGKKA